VVFEKERLKMKIMYQLLNEKSILVQKYSGLFSQEVFIRYNRFQMGNPDLNNVRKVLVDFRDIKFGLAPEKFSENVNHAIEIRKEDNRINHLNHEVMIVFWVDKPLPTVIAHIFKANFSNMNYNYCSSFDKLLKLLELPKDDIQLLSIIDNLENEF
jgi:hypothetical protein